MCGVTEKKSPDDTIILANDHGAICDDCVIIASKRIARLKEDRRANGQGVNHG
jgi:hypothetical protein